MSGLTERDVARGAVSASLWLIGGIALFLTARRFMGAVSSPMPSAVLLTAIILGTWACAVGAWDARSGRWALGILTLVAVVCSYPGNRLVDWVAWLPAIGLSWWLPRATWRPRWWGGLARSRMVGSAAAPTEILLQEFTRSRTAGGNEVIRGTLLAEFSPGERTAGTHVGFCPPFERMPRCEAHTADPAVANVKMAQVLHQGALIEVRLASPAVGARSVTIHFLATDAATSD